MPFAYLEHLLDNPQSSTQWLSDRYCSRNFHTLFVPSGWTFERINLQSMHCRYRHKYFQNHPSMSWQGQSFEPNLLHGGMQCLGPSHHVVCCLTCTGVAGVLGDWKFDWSAARSIQALPHYSIFVSTRPLNDILLCSIQRWTAWEKVPRTRKIQISVVCSKWN